jgi:hypothetical protein
LTGEARWWNQPSLNSSETALSIDVGYYLTPNLRAYLGYSFGAVNDRDFGDSRSAGGVFFGITVKLNELFDGFGLQKLPPPAIAPESPTTAAALVRQTDAATIAHPTEANAPAEAI